MTVRLVASCLALGLLNFAWAAGLVILSRIGLVSPWIVWLVPLPIIAGGAMSWMFFRHWPTVACNGKAAGYSPTASASFHAPASLQAPARDPAHRLFDLLARIGR